MDDNWFPEPPPAVCKELNNRNAVSYFSSATSLLTVSSAVVFTLIILVPLYPS
jgi:hypothetical protein